MGIDYSGSLEPKIPVKKHTVNVVDEDGKPVSKLTDHHRNRLYSKARELKEDLKDRMCKRSEIGNPNPDPNDPIIRKMKNSEMSKETKNKMTTYKNIMRVLDSDNPNARSTEDLRRR